MVFMSLSKCHYPFTATLLLKPMTCDRELQEWEQADLDLRLLYQTISKFENERFVEVKW